LPWHACSNGSTPLEVVSCSFMGFKFSGGVGTGGAAADAYR
jgi:hypothetical protein